MTRFVALALTLLTGFTGLVYEVTWQKILATVLGSHSEATAAVLGIFLGGLALGYALFGRISDQVVRGSGAGDPRRRLLRLYGLVELGIGVYALSFPFFFSLVSRASVALPHVSEALGFATDVGLACLLIGPPTILMGGTIPLLTQALSVSSEESTRLHSTLYALNTGGAFLGAAVAALFLVPTLGLFGCLVVMGSVNVGVGAAFALLSLRGRLPDRPVAAAAEWPREPGGTAARISWRWSAVALVSGFSVMTLQATLNRIGSLALGASYFTFSMVVAIFVLCIAIGSLCVSLAPRVHRLALPLTQWLLVAYVIVLFPFVEDAGYWSQVVRARLALGPEGFYAHQLSLFLSMLALCLVPLALSGALVPLLFDRLRGIQGDLGGLAGRLYSWNTAGSLLGALVGGYVLLFWLDLHHVYRIAALGLAVSAALLTAESGRRRLVPALAGLAAAGLAIAIPPAWSPEKLSAGLFRMRLGAEALRGGPEDFFERLMARRPEGSVLFYSDDPTSSVAVINHGRDRGHRGRDPSRPSLSIVTNGKNDGNVPRDSATMGLAALLPALFSDAPERAFVVGFGTGITVGELAALDSMREVVVSEISPAVLEAAPLFRGFNGDVLRSRKTRVVRSDAYRALLRSEGEFDIVVSEPSNPWVAGVEMLFSREFLREVRTRLGSDGVFAQWMHRYEVDSETIELVLATYLQVFDSVGIWFVNDGDMILLGFAGEGGKIDLERPLRRYGEEQMQAAFRRYGIDSFGRLVAHEAVPHGVLRRGDLEGPVHTLMHPRLSYQAARAFFANARGLLPLARHPSAAEDWSRNSMAVQYIRRFQGPEVESVRSIILDEACAVDQATCANSVARWLMDSGLTPALASAVSEADADRFEAVAGLLYSWGERRRLSRADGAGDLIAAE